MANGDVLAGQYKDDIYDITLFILKIVIYII